MATTYDDFYNSAKKSGLLSQFSESDLGIAQSNPDYGAALLDIYKDRSKATTSEQKMITNEAAAQLRKQYGSYGTGDAGNKSFVSSYGSKIDNLTDKISNYGDFERPTYTSQYTDTVKDLMNQIKDYGSYTPAEYQSRYGSAVDSLIKQIDNYKQFTPAEYQSRYDEQIQNLLGDLANYKQYTPEEFVSRYGDRISNLTDQIQNYGSFDWARNGQYQDLLDSILSREAFSYDPEQDENFSAYRKAYLREGDRAAANALAQAAAATGGRASSWAQTASQQAGNYYAAQLADMIPQLRQQALDEYNNALAQRINDLGLLTSDRDTEYQQYLNELARLRQNAQELQALEDTDYSRYQDRTNREMQLNEQGRQRLQDNLSTLTALDERDYNRYGDKTSLDYQIYLNQLAQLQQRLQNAQGQEQTDYSRYLDQTNREMQLNEQGRQRLLENLGMYQGQEQNEYKRYLDETDAQYQLYLNGLQQLRDNLSMYQGQEQTDYSRYLSELDEDYRRDQTQRAADQQAFENAVDRAALGDWSGISDLYGPEAANRMMRAWAVDNPLAAYQSGNITGEDYFTITGTYPIGYTPAGGVAGSGQRAASDILREQEHEMQNRATNLLNSAMTQEQIEAAKNYQTAVRNIINSETTKF